MRPPAVLAIALCSALTLLLPGVALGQTDTYAHLAVLEEPWLSPEDCHDTSPSFRIEALDEATFVLRESPCVDREAPFLFLLIGSEQALLVDSGTLDGAILVEVVTQKLAERGLGFSDLIVARVGKSKRFFGEPTSGIGQYVELFNTNLASKLDLT